MKLLIRKDRKYFWKRGDLNVEEGIIREKDILGSISGEKVKTHLGIEFTVIEPRLLDYFDILKRGPQVILPKDAIIMVTYSGVKEGEKVVEVGTGSGWLTVFLARAVGRKGKVITYEIRKDFIEIARKNLEILGLLDRVEFRNEDPFKVGIPGCDHVFLDVKEPLKIFEFKDKVSHGGYLVFYCIQMTQVLRIKEVVDRFKDLVFEKVVEIIEREWVIGDRVCRPRQWLDHTGFLVFVRKL